MKCLAVLLCLSLTTPLFAATEAGPGGAPMTSTSHPIRPGEALAIQVSGEPGMSKAYLVDTNGTITLEMVGSVRAADRTAEQVAEELRARLRHFLKSPSVTVMRSAPVRQEVLVTGEVARQGSVTLGPGAAVLDLLTAVGGVGPSGDGARASLVRRGQAQPIAVNLEQLMKGDMSQNVPVCDGDILQVPKKELATYQIVGEVRLPGTRPLDAPISVLDALVSSGGLTERADRNRLLLTRKGETEPTAIDLDQVLAGAAGSAPMIQAGDVLQIGARIVVAVAGEVKVPGERLLRNGGTLMEAVTMAGGLTPDADSAAIQITHRDGTTETASLENVTGIVGGPEVKSGDMVLVGRSKPQVVTVTGAVRNPGAMRYREGMKVSELLMTAGLMETSDWKKIHILSDGDGNSHKVAVFDLEKFLQSPTVANVALRAGDQVFVDARKRGQKRSLLTHLREVLPFAGLFFGL
jgi:polysaccharide export outer membrane protein